MRNIPEKKDRLPREVCIASIDLRMIWPVDTIEKRIDDILERMENVYVFEPDVICLPETFQTSWVRERKKRDEYAEDERIPGTVTSIIAEQARKHNCYIICPLVTKSEDHYYNSAILLDRKGKIGGVYHKTHPVISRSGKPLFTPGTVEAPVFETDFGKVGMQICYDANWFDSWDHLKKQGAEIIFFPSQAPFINVLKHHAWINEAYIVSSTGEGARIIDITGDEITVSGQFERWVCDTVKLDKALIHVWPYVRKIKDIRNKYKDKIKIKIYHPENWMTFESQDPEVSVKDILKEFEIPTYSEHLARNEIVQDKYRP